MAFTNAWVETDPDGNTIFVSQLDDSDRLIKGGVRERLEGDPAAPDLTGLIEVGSWPTAPKPRKGAARVYVDTEANILAFDTTKREDGRMAISSDTKRLFHVATVSVAEIAYCRSVGGVITGGFQVSSGTVGIGAAPSSVTGIRVGGGAALTGAPLQMGIFVDVSPDAGATSFLGVRVLPQTPAAAFTITTLAGVYISSGVRGAGSTITTLYGLYIEDQLAGGQNFAINTGKGLIRFGDNLQVWDAGAGIPKQVSFGANDSGGAGFKTLRIAN